MTESTSDYENSSDRLHKTEYCVCYGSLDNKMYEYPDSMGGATIAIRLEDEYFIPVTTDHSESYIASSKRKYPIEGNQNYIVEQHELVGVDLSLDLKSRGEGIRMFKLGIFLSKILGFQSNPFIYNCSSQQCADPSMTKNKGRNSPMADLRLSMLSTLSTSYNTLSISWAIQIMSKTYSINDRDQSICSTALLAGMIVGQLFGGILGDYIGRHKAMTFVMLIQIFAALASSLCFNRVLLDPFFGYHFNYSRNWTIYQNLAICRFLLGIGCGGVYPLSATLTAESTSCPQDRGKLVALTFSMQGIGYLLAPSFCWALVGIFGEVSDVSWRIMLGSGSIFGVILVVLRTISRRRRGTQIWKPQGGSSTVTTTSLHSSSSSEENKNHEMMCAHTIIGIDHKINHELINRHQDEEEEILHHYQELNNQTIMEAIRKENSLTKKLIGTAGCWFLFDVLFYGNTLFQPVVLHSVFGSQESLLDAAQDSSIMALLALPGYFISIACIGRQSPRFIQLQGFLCMSILYFLVGYNFELLSENRMMLLVLYGLTFFFSDYGPNTTTFMLPSMTFSPCCRSTLNGISAACGKIGAVLGASLFEPTASYLGNNLVLMICSGLSTIGAIMTCCGVSSNVGFDQADSTEYVSETAIDNNFARNRNKSSPSFLDYDG